MAEHADNGEDVFVYTGGEQVVPRDVTHVIVDKSVKIIRREAVDSRDRLVSIEMHDGIEIIEEYAFFHSLTGSIKLPGVRVVEGWAFAETDLTDVAFGDKLETIGAGAFCDCTSLKSIKMPTVRDIDRHALANCDQLTDVEMPEVERIGDGAFESCTLLRRIAIPLKDGIFDGDNVFHGCDNLVTVDFLGGIYKTISSLHMESWGNEMREEVDRINRVLPTTYEKTVTIQRLIESILERLNHYKTEHKALVKEAMTLLELALWKAKLLDEKEEAHFLGEKRLKKKTMTDNEAGRNEQRIISGASIVIKNVLPFLTLDE
jgi:hypothetical protein